MSAAQVVCLASWNVDWVTRIASPLAPGQTLTGAGLQRLPGGKGSNAAVACARLGVSTAVLAGLGQDAGGDMALALWREEGLDTQGVRRFPSEPSGTALILVYPSGDNSIVVIPGANACLKVEHLEAASPALRSARVVMASCEVPLAVTQAAFALARAHGGLTLLNPAPALPLPEALWPLVDVLTPNAGELAQLSGQADVTRGAAALLARGVGAVVVTLGENGCALFRRDQPALFLPAHRVQVVDTVGAGDTFTGALAAALAQTTPWPKALAQANAAAAMATQARGALDGMPTREALQDFLAQHR